MPVRAVACDLGYVVAAIHDADAAANGLDDIVEEIILISSDLWRTFP